MYLDTTTYIYETLNTVPDDIFDADIDLGYEKNFYELRKCDNESLYIPIVPTLIEESAIPIIVDEKPLWCGRSDICAHGAAAHTYSFSILVVEVMGERIIM